MIRAIVAGAMGRMGRRIIERIQEEEGIRLTGALERPGHPQEGADIGELTGTGPRGVPLSTAIAPLLREAEVVIDFTLPGATLENLRAAAEADRAMVIGTTGFTAEESETMRRLARGIPVLAAPNMSLGVNLLFKILPAAARALGAAYDVEIVEAHHRFKKDAPSGTALRLAQGLAEALERDPEEDFLYGRRGNIGERGAREIGIHAVRGGDIVGDHTVLFCGQGERLEFTHRASSRDPFVNGAIRAARWIVGQKPGLYSMLDMLEM